MIRNRTVSPRFPDAPRGRSKQAALGIPLMLFLSASAFGAQPPASGTAAGQQSTPHPIILEATALSHVRDAVVHGCGVRLTGGVPGTPVSSWFDVSFNVFRRSVGLVQSMAYEIRRSEYDGESRPDRVSVQSTWITASDAGGRLGENIERRDTLVYRVLVDDVLALFEAVATGRALTLGIRRWGEREDRVHSAIASLDTDSRRQVAACLGALSLE